MTAEDDKQSLIKLGYLTYLDSKYWKNVQATRQINMTAEDANLIQNEPYYKKKNEELTKEIARLTILLEKEQKKNSGN